MEELIDYIATLGIFWLYILLMFLVCTILELLTSKGSMIDPPDSGPSESPK